MLQEKPNLDVSPIVLEAQSIVRDATTIYLHHLRLWCIGIVVHGSALKGGYIPGAVISISNFTWHHQLSATVVNSHLRYVLHFIET